MCLLCTCYEYNYLFLSHHNLILCILYKCHMGVLMNVLYLCDSTSRYDGCP